MSKKIIGLLSCFVCLAVLLSSCQTIPGGENNGFGTNISDTHTQEAPDSLNKSEPDETVRSTVAEWKIAYLEYLESIKDTHLEYSLVFIDGDDIPELYVSGDCEATGDGVCSYKNGEAVEQRLIRIGGGRYIEKSGWLNNGNGNMGHFIINVYKLTENGFEQTFHAESVEHVNISENYEYSFSYEYEVEGKPVSESEYNAAVDASFDYEKAVSLSDNSVKYDQIRQMIVEFN